jgi:hypothetical protein
MSPFRLMLLLILMRVDSSGTLAVVTMKREVMEAINVE